MYVVSENGFRTGLKLLSQREFKTCAFNKKKRHGKKINSILQGAFIQSKCLNNLEQV